MLVLDRFSNDSALSHWKLLRMSVVPTLVSCNGSFTFWIHLIYKIQEIRNFLSLILITRERNETNGFLRLTRRNGGAVVVLDRFVHQEPVINPSQTAVKRRQSERTGPTSPPPNVRFKTPRFVTSCFRKKRNVAAVFWPINSIVFFLCSANRKQCCGRFV